MRQRPGRDPVEDEERSVDRADRLRVGEDPIRLPGVGIVDQEPALRLDLVGVEEVVTEVGLRQERTCDVERRRVREDEESSENRDREGLATTGPG